MSVSAESRFRIDDKNVVHQVFDDEVLVVHIHTGTYYSLLGVSGAIWRQVVAGVQVGDITRWAGETYDGDRSMIETTIRQFVERLVAENLVEPDTSAVVSNPVAPAPTGTKQPFVTPKLDTFTDMQELLLLDPVHDVEDAGWPVAKTPVQK